MFTATVMLKNSDLTPDPIIDALDAWTLPGTTHRIDGPGELSYGGGSGRASLRQVFI